MPPMSVAPGMVAAAVVKSSAFSAMPAKAFVAVSVMTPEAMVTS